MENFGFLPLDLVKNTQNAVKKPTSDGTKRKSSTKSNIWIQFSNAKELCFFMDPRLNEPPASLGLSQVWQTPKQLGTVQRLRVFLLLQIGTSSVGTEFPWPKHRPESMLTFFSASPCFLKNQQPLWTLHLCAEATKIYVKWEVDLVPWLLAHIFGCRRSTGENRWGMSFGLKLLILTQVSHTSLNGIYLGGDQTMQFYGNFEAFSL